MVVYIKNPIDTLKKLPDLINDFGKTVGYKVNIQKSTVFLYTNNEISETDIRKKFPFDIARRKENTLLKVGTSTSSSLVLCPGPPTQ